MAIPRVHGFAIDNYPPLRILFSSTKSSGRPDGHRAFFVLWIAGIDSGRIEFVRRQTGVGRIKQFLNAGLVRVLDLKRTGQWEPGWGTLQLAHDRMRAVPGAQRALGTQTNDRPIR